MRVPKVLSRRLRESACTSIILLFAILPWVPQQVFAQVANDEKVLVQWSIPVGQKVRYVYTNERKMNVGEAAPETTQSRSTYVTLEALEHFDNGSIRIRETIDRMKSKKSLPPHDVDSDRGDIPLAMKVFHGRIFSFTLSPEGEISDVKLENEGPKLPTDLEKMLGSINKPQAFENLVPKFRLPAGGAKLTQTWDSVSKLEGSPVGDTKSTMTYEFTGTGEARDAKIANIKLTVKFDVDFDSKGTVAIPINWQEFKGGGEGKAEFDITNGRLIQYRIDEESIMVAEANEKTISVFSTGYQQWKLIGVE